ncbi:hypothetical protein WG66_013052 [Moniliophthora roreri]|nr:hypothetical protein WG66_013052 [Moniliophthora roreri]
MPPILSQSYPFHRRLERPQMKDFRGVPTSSQRYSTNLRQRKKSQKRWICVHGGAKAGSVLRFWKLFSHTWLYGNFQRDSSLSTTRTRRLLCS